jgi:putative transposase
LVFGHRTAQTVDTVKKEDPALAWWSDNSKCVYQESFRDLDRALRDFAKSRRGERRGRRLGFPKCKKRGRCRDSFRVTGVIRCVGTSVMLPRLGVIKTHESTRKLARRLEAGTARIMSATVTRTAHRWFVSFTVQVEKSIPLQHPHPGSSIGIDLGVTTLLTGADSRGAVILAEGPSPLRASMRKLCRASRAHSRKVAGSRNRRKSCARLSRLHARVANIRADALHKATSMFASRYETIVVEDLNVTGMASNRRLARAVMDQGFGQARSLLQYKATWNGGRLIVAECWFPSSKICSGCGSAKTKLNLSERTYRCDKCGLVIDRDVNAARNLLNLAASGAERLNACGGTVRPGHARVIPVNQEPGAARGQDRDRRPTTDGCRPGAPIHVY